MALQLKIRKIGGLRNPILIYFAALDLRQDEDSAYGLAFNLNDRAKLGENIIYAPELISDFRFRTMNEKGIPIREDKGNRTSYTRQDGLSRFSLGRSSDVVSFDGNLALSADDGRVGVVSGGNTK